jgi:hypothetical protein
VSLVLVPFIWTNSAIMHGHHYRLPINSKPLRCCDEDFGNCVPILLCVLRSG